MNYEKENGLKGMVSVYPNIFIAYFCTVLRVLAYIFLAGCIGVFAVKIFGGHTFKRDIFIVPVFLLIIPDIILHLRKQRIRIEENRGNYTLIVNGREITNFQKKDFKGTYGRKTEVCSFEIKSDKCVLISFGKKEALTAYRKANEKGLYVNIDSENDIEDRRD